MVIYSGKAVFGGIAIGKISLYKKGEAQVKRTKVDDVEAEVARYHAAKEVAIEQLGALYDKAVKEDDFDVESELQVQRYLKCIR